MWQLAWTRPGAPQARCDHWAPMSDLAVTTPLDPCTAHDDPGAVRQGRRPSDVGSAPTQVAHEEVTRSGPVDGDPGTCCLQARGWCPGRARPRSAAAAATSARLCAKRTRQQDRSLTFCARSRAAETRRGPRHRACPGTKLRPCAWGCRWRPGRVASATDPLAQEPVRVRLRRREVPGRSPAVGQVLRSPNARAKRGSPERLRRNSVARLRPVRNTGEDARPLGRPYEGSAMRHVARRQPRCLLSPPPS